MKFFCDVVGSHSLPLFFFLTLMIDGKVASKGGVLFGLVLGTSPRSFLDGRTQHHFASPPRMPHSCRSHLSY